LQRWSTIRDLIQRLCDLPLPLTLLADEGIATLFHRTFAPLWLLHRY